ncbi:unnamed protein product [Mycena citricolor]|uniref:ADP-ribosylation factor n=1 Tax=Mycena citricolor TaxID=2018698 RepID=A0AAD2JU75_9AGAR|nr:unnamed protein product [Mycena citricolor]
MPSILSRFMNVLFPGSEYVAVIIGLNASGKTTLLYRLVFGEIVTTIPTIGFNVETVNLPTRQGQNLNLVCWDVGGCGREHMTHIIVEIASRSHVVIWLIDSSDRSRLDETVAEFERVDARLNTPGVYMPRNRPILVIATKQDLPKAMTLDEIRIRIAPIIKGRSVFCVGAALNQDLRNGVFLDAFGWLLAAAESTRKGDPGPPVTPVRTDSIEDKLSSWLARWEEDSSCDEFLSQFEQRCLPAWDHYTHVRLAYLLLLKHGRQKGESGMELLTPTLKNPLGKDLILAGIQHYIAESPEQTGGRTFHLTMTYFWIQMIHFGIRSLPDSPPPTAEGSDDFARFLLLNPHIVQGDLWADYYTKGALMSPEAKKSLVLPDKKALPSLVVRDAITKIGKRQDGWRQYN